MVVTGSNVRDDGAECIERRVVALLDLTLHVLPDLVHGHVSRALDKGLHVVIPGAGDQLAHSVEFCKLRLVVGILDATGTEPVAQRDGRVVRSQDVADVIEVFVEEGFAVVEEAPFAHDAAAPADDAAQTLVRQVDIMPPDACVDGEVVHALLALLDEGVAVEFPGKVFHPSVYFFQCLVDGHGAHGDGTVADNPFACFVYVGSGGKVHERVASPFAAPKRLLHFLLDAGGGGGITDIGVDLHQEVAPDNHRFGFRVIYICRQERTSGGQFLADELGRDMRVDAQFPAIHVLADGHVFHFRGDDALLGIVHLCATASGFGTERQGDVLEAQVIQRMVIAAHTPIFRRNLGQTLHVATSENPRFAQAGQPFLQVDIYIGVAVRAAGVIDVDLRVGRDDFLAFLVKGRAGYLLHTAHGHAQVRIDLPRQVNLLGAGVFDALVHNRCR